MTPLCLWIDGTCLVPLEMQPVPDVDKYYAVKFIEVPGVTGTRSSTSGARITASIEPATIINRAAECRTASRSVIGIRESAIA